MGLFLKTLKDFPLQAIMTVSGVIVVFLNLWLASQLMPFVSKLNGLEFRVGAVEAFNEENKPLIPRFISSEVKTAEMVDDIKEIKNDVNVVQTQVNRVEGKIDQINSKL